MKEHFDILVVDDEPVVTHAATKVLSSEGFTVDRAGDADAAVRQVRENDYSLVLCDLMLPGTSGLELIDVIHASLPLTPVVLITGYATVKSALSAFRLGAFDFIPKPFDTFELIGVVQRGLEMARMSPRDREAISLSRSDLTGGSSGADDFYAIGRHGWVVLEEDGSARMGLGETFAVLREKIGELLLAEAGDDLLQGNRYVRIVTESQSAHRVWAPLSGQVIGVNEQAFRSAGQSGWPDVCKQWVVRIVPSDLEEELASLTPR